MNNKSFYLSRKAHAVIVLATAVLAVHPSPAQNAVSTSQAITIHVNTGRPIAEVLEGLQHHFRSPMTYEEAPFENQQELTKISILQGGIQKTLLVRPQVDFTIKLEVGDSTPFLAAQTVLGEYVAAGLPGVYRVVQQNNRVDVIPVQVLSTNGTMRGVQPVMSSPITFPLATRSALDTIQLVVNGVASHSGAKILPLNLPFSPLETFELSAVGQSAGDVIEDLGAKLGGTLSFQCLFDPTNKTYYLNVAGVSSLSPPGNQSLPDGKAHPKTASLDSPFFVKKEVRNSLRANQGA